MSSLDVVLYLRNAAGAAIAAVHVRYDGCTGSGIDNGSRKAMVSQSLIALMLEPLSTGYSVEGDLPED